MSTIPTGQESPEVPEKPDAVQGSNEPSPTVLPSIGYGTSSASVGVTYRTEAAPQRRMRSAHRADPIESARAAIVRLTDATDTMSAVDRSNLFDDWKDALNRVAADGMKRPVFQRQIVGMMLLSSFRRDVADFSPLQLQALRTVTNSARNASGGGDVQRATRTLSESALLRPLGLGAEGAPEEDDAELDAFINKAMSKDAPPRTCEACGASCGSTHNFCAHCGRPLRSDQAK